MYAINADMLGMHASGACGGSNTAYVCFILLIKRWEAHNKANAAFAKHEHALAGGHMKTSAARTGCRLQEDAAARTTL